MSFEIIFKLFVQSFAKIISNFSLVANRMEINKAIKQTVEHEVDCDFKFTWKIENISKDFEVLESDEFNLEPICISKWKLILYYSRLEKILKIGLRRIDVSAHSVLVDASFSVRNSKGTFFVKRSYRGTHVGEEEPKFSLEPFSRPSHEKDVRDDLRNVFRLCKDDTLVIDGSIVAVACCSHDEPKEKAFGELHSALSSSYKEKIFTDCEFDIDGETFPAHKFILAARSPVFRKMFESKMAESTDNKILITDIEKPILKQFLEFLYSGSFPFYNTEVALKLYSVADKYDVPSLKLNCRHTLLLNITNANVCDIIRLADAHHDEVLYKEAIAHIVKDFKKVFQTDGWKKMMKENIELSVQIITIVVPSPDDDE